MIKKALIVVCSVALTTCSVKDYLGEVNCDTAFIPVNESSLISRICLGSCADQTASQPLLYQAANLNPDLFIYLGDNIYCDTECMSTLAEKYSQLCAKDEFKALKSTCPILAIWDDHDYGANDAGEEYCKKEESKEVFMKFWGEDHSVERSAHKGIYHSYIFGEGEQTVQVILLDLRTFRTSMNYQPNYSPDASMLGPEQWDWLEEQFLQSAQIRIVASSVQFGSQFHGYESWNNFPLEKNRMFNLIESTEASGVFFISGDMHYGELSRMEPAGTYPIYDFTSSGITETFPPEPNENRIDNAVDDNHIGIIDIDWNGDSTLIGFSLVDGGGVKQFEHHVYLSEIGY
jgi:alkaline phosphatase D